MKFPFMLRLDNCLGTALCHLLGAVAKIFSWVFRRDHSLSRAPRRVLFLKFVGLGSIERASFLLEGVKKRYPQAEVVFASFPGAAELVKLYPQVDRVLVLREKNLFLLALDSLGMLLWIWTHPADWVIDLEVHSKFSSILTILSGARNRFGFNYVPSRFRENLYTHLVYWNPHRHVDHCYRAIGKLLGLLYYGQRMIEPCLDPGHEKRAEALLAQYGIHPGDKVLAINPNAGEFCLERRWPLENFSAVLNHLPEVASLKVLLLGSKSERPYVAKLYESLNDEIKKKAFNLAGELSLPELIAVLKRTQLLLTNDSGPLHLADVLGVPVFSLWGPSAPWIYGPKGRRHRAFYRPIYCSPCVHLTTEPPCRGDHQCLKRLEWEPIAHEISKFFKH